MNPLVIFLSVLTFVLIMLNISMRDDIGRLKSLLKRMERRILLLENRLTGKPEPSIQKSYEKAISQDQISQPSKHQKQARETARKPNRLIVYIADFFKTGNLAAKIGIIVLFFGIAFLLKYAASQGLFPVEYRFIAAAICGIIIMQIGWFIRKRKSDYALVLQGGGIGILFLVVFTAYKLYNLIPASLAFGCLVLLTAFLAFFAIVQNSKSLAMLGVIGGFLAPVLAGSSEGNHVILFSYYLVLNIGIFAVSWFRSWRILNLLGFLFTYVIGTAWGGLNYQSQLFSTTEPFLVAYFLLYAVIPVLFLRNQKTPFKKYVDGAIIFGNPLVAFSLQAILVKPYEYALACSALTLGIFYIVMAHTFINRQKEEYKLLSQSFIALGVIFSTITIPLAFDGQITSATWAIEAAGVYWICCKQDRFLGRIFSVLLIIGSSIAFGFDYKLPIEGTLPFLNGMYLGSCMIALGSWVCSYAGFRYQNILKKEKKITLGLFVFGSLWWIISGYNQTHTFLEWYLQAKGIAARGFAEVFYLLYISFIMLASSLIGRRFQWTRLSHFSLLLGFFALATLIVADAHPSAYFGFIIWPIAFTVGYFALRMAESVNGLSSLLLKISHSTVLWALVATLSWEIYFQFSQWVFEGPAWGQAMVGLVPVVALGTILFKSKRIAWPLKKFEQCYLNITLVPIVAFLWAWVFYSNLIHTGDASPLPYIPLLNPLEIVQAFFVLLFPFWCMQVKKAFKLSNKTIGIIVGITYFFWLNAIILRSVHHYAGIPYVLSSLASSPIAQMALSIYWAAIGISLMIYAHKKRQRWLWISGMSLEGIVVVKLFLVDLSKTGTLERIISFISVGLLLLAVGYFAPIPNKKKKTITHEK